MKTKIKYKILTLLLTLTILIGVILTLPLTVSAKDSISSTFSFGNEKDFIEKKESWLYEDDYIWQHSNTDDWNNS